jgi:hypothetical protein
MTDVEPDWAAHQRPVAHHPAGGAGLRAYGFGPDDPASVAAATLAGLVPDANGRLYPMAEARRVRLGRPHRPEGGPDAAA